MIWPSAYRAWGLVSGAKVHVDSGIMNPKTMQRPKRPADDAFGAETRGAGLYFPQTFDLGQSVGADVAAPQASYLPGYEWWLHDQNKPRTPDSLHTLSPSPNSGSTHSSPSAAMPIPFSFDQAHNFWDVPLLQDMDVNFVAGV